MDLLGDPLTTSPIQTGWELTFELYPSWQFGFIDILDRQFANGLVWTRTGSESPEPLLTLYRRNRVGMNDAEYIFGRPQGW